MKLILLIFFTTFICLSLMMCKKESSEPIQICQYDSSNDGLKSWYYYKAGTRWIYREQASGLFDTLTVYYDSGGVNGNGTTHFEYWVMSTNSDFRYIYQFDLANSTKCKSSKECTCHKVSRTKAKPFTLDREGKLFLYPVIQGNFIESGDSCSTVTDVHQEFQLGDLLFSNVAVWDIPDDESEGGVRTRYWIGKNIGIIKRINFNTAEEWHLVNYEIVQ